MVPLFARWGERDRHRTMVLSGYYARDAAAYDLGLAPLFFHGRHTDGSHYTHLAPLIWHWGDRNEERTLALPLYFGGRDRRRGAYHDVVMPLFARWGERDRHRTMVLSGYYARDATGYDVGLAPLFFHGRRSDGSQYTHLAPLFWHGRRADGSHYTHLAPLVWHWGSRNEEGTVVVPFYVGFRSDDRYRRAVTPLFYQWGDRRVRKSLLFPIAYLAREGASSLFLSPLVVAHFDAVEQTQRMVVFPLYWRFATRDSSVNVGFPLWWDFRYRRRGSRLSILFPLGFRYDRRDETTTMFLNVVYTRGKEGFPDAWSFHLFPLFDLASYNRDHFKWQVLMGMVGRERQGRQARWRIVYVWTDPS
ncbi:MAG: hypothetical protein HY906_22595 [Deltaproteobacteria bacterium]|nr:hypothetical protein [Deltaproteobacteria bacterium]